MSIDSNEPPKNAKMYDFFRNGNPSLTIAHLIDLRRTPGSTQKLFAGERDQHSVHGAMRARLRRRTAATHRLRVGQRRPAERACGQLRRTARPRGRRGDRTAAVHSVRGHGVREQRQGPECRPRARVRRDATQPEESARSR